MKPVKQKKHLKWNTKCKLCLIPSLIGTAIFFIIPYLRVLYYSLIDNQFRRNFVWFDNYIKTLTNEYFLLSLKNSLLLIVIAVPVLMALALVISLALSYGGKWVRKTRFAWGIILPMIFSPFGVVVMHQYMKNIDNSVIEATRLETNSIFRILFTSVIPQLRVCIFAVVLFVFADCWNMVEQPMLFLKDDGLKTLSVFITNAQNYTGEVLFPAAVIFSIPVLILYLFFNENLEKGLTLGDLS